MAHHFFKKDRSGFFLLPLLLLLAAASQENARSAQEPTGDELKTLTIAEWADWGAWDQVKQKLNEGAAPDQVPNPSYPTALLKAVEKNNLEITNLLLQKGANPNANDPRSQEPIIFKAVKLAASRRPFESGRESSIPRPGPPDSVARSYSAGRRLA